MGGGDTKSWGTTILGGNVKFFFTVKVPWFVTKALGAVHKLRGQIGGEGGGGLGILKMVTVGHVEYMNAVVGGGLGILKMVTVGHGGGGRGSAIFLWSRSLWTAP